MPHKSKPPKNLYNSQNYPADANIYNPRPDMPNWMLYVFLAIIALCFWILYHMSQAKKQSDQQTKNIVVIDEKTGDCYILYDVKVSGDTITIADQFPCN